MLMPASHCALFHINTPPQVALKTPWVVISSDKWPLRTDVSPAPPSSAAAECPRQIAPQVRVNKRRRSLCFLLDSFLRSNPENQRCFARKTFPERLWDQILGTTFCRCCTHKREQRHILSTQSHTNQASVRRFYMCWRDSTYSNSFW